MDDRVFFDEAFPEYILIGGPHDGQRGYTFFIPLAYLELPLNRGILTALNTSPTPVARYDLVMAADDHPARDDEGRYRYQWREAGEPL